MELAEWRLNVIAFALLMPEIKKEIARLSPFTEKDFVLVDTNDAMVVTFKCDAYVYEDAIKPHLKGRGLVEDVEFKYVAERRKGAINTQGLAKLWRGDPPDFLLHPTSFVEKYHNININHWPAAAFNEPGNVFMGIVKSDVIFALEVGFDLKALFTRKSEHNDRLQRLKTQRSHPVKGTLVSLREKLKCDAYRAQESARQVIMPSTSTIDGTSVYGVSEESLRRLYVDETVTIEDADNPPGWLAELIANGPERYPGAKYIVDEKTKYRIPNMRCPEEHRRAKALAFLKDVIDAARTKTFMISRHPQPRVFKSTRRLFAEQALARERLEEPPDSLKKLIANGPGRYPGSNYIFDGKTRYKVPSMKDPDEEKAAAFLKRVAGASSAGSFTISRHLERAVLIEGTEGKGDFVILKRAPTNNKASVVVTDEYEVVRGTHCNHCAEVHLIGFGADFDGLVLSCAKIARTAGRFLTFKSRLCTYGKPRLRRQRCR